MKAQSIPKYGSLKKASIKLQEKIKNISTIDTVANAKEIEEARALGDLRENADSNPQ